jgi:alkanesulfonate monooxygenase SsuD/methylene tetrahydromethanopterin reductase-like flavin-dependent oxidoreductase (luciferase family)
LARIGYHASHEQYALSVLLSYVQTAERSGFDCAMSSEHFKPWSNAQGHAGHAWSWLGAALATTRLPFGIITAPGHRHHPAILAQSAATLSEMFPERLWLALGSGQRAAPQ